MFKDRWFGCTLLEAVLTWCKAPDFPRGFRVVSDTRVGGGGARGLPCEAIWVDERLRGPGNYLFSTDCIQQRCHFSCFFPL